MGGGRKGERRWRGGRREDYGRSNGAGRGKLGEGRRE